MGYVGVLMAVELYNRSELFLLGPLAAEAIGNIIYVFVENLDLCLVGQSFICILCNFLSVLLNLMSIGLEVILSLSNSLCELQHFESKCFDGDDLIGVNVNLLLIAFLIGERLLKAKFVDSLTVFLWDDRTVVSCLNFGTCLSENFNGSLSLYFSLRGQINGISECSNGGEGKNKLH